MKLKLDIADEILAELRNDMGMKKMMGNLYGRADEFICHILSAVEKGEKTLTLVWKKSRKKRKKTCKT